MLKARGFPITQELFDWFRLQPGQNRQVADGVYYTVASLPDASKQLIVLYEEDKEGVAKSWVSQFGLNLDNGIPHQVQTMPPAPAPLPGPSHGSAAPLALDADDPPGWTPPTHAPQASTFRTAPPPPAPADDDDDIPYWNPPPRPAPRTAPPPQARMQTPAEKIISGCRPSHPRRAIRDIIAESKADHTFNLEDTFQKVFGIFKHKPGFDAEIFRDDVARALRHAGLSGKVKSVLDMMPLDAPQRDLHQAAPRGRPASPPRPAPGAPADARKAFDSLSTDALRRNGVLNKLM